VEAHQVDVLPLSVPEADAVSHGDREHAILEPDAALSYLAAAGLLPPSSGGGWVARGVPGRCANVLVVDGSGKGFLIKRGLGEPGRATVGNEAEMVAALRARSARLAPYLPAVSSFSEERGEVIVDVATGSRDLDEVTDRTGSFPAGVAMEVGKALAYLHEIPLAAAERVGSGRRPWVLTAHRPSPTLLARLGRHGWGALKEIQGSRAACRMLDRAAGGWRRVAIVHNDVKWSNIVLVGARMGLRGGVRLIDFELCGPGEPAWDVGCALAEHLWHDHVAPGPRAGPTEPDPAAAAAPSAAASLLIDVYVATRGLDHRAELELIDRVRTMTCARLVQRAIETDTADEPRRALEVIEHLAGAP
jgi:aminoglycoside phosphotransferase (APT) family kinase protein